MKALSLWQPFASLIVHGAKPFETRTWPAPAWLIGERIAIHAATRRLTLRDLDALPGVAIASALCVDWERTVAYGAVVGSAVVRGAYQVRECNETDWTVTLGAAVRGSPARATAKMDMFGDFTPGRWIWWLTDVVRLEPPTLAKGARGIWEWDQGRRAA